ncbi:hypothetical protein SBDP1_570031 [Syntrophobacter sp. SbD1]|nr:hypothetical protein SBDP1_570031 [Syntrophobacter sp. SbD1]
MLDFASLFVTYAQVPVITPHYYDFQNKREDE